VWGTGGGSRSLHSKFGEVSVLRRTQSVAAKINDDRSGGLRAANEQVLSTASLRRSQAKPVEAFIVPDPAPIPAAEDVAERMEPAFTPERPSFTPKADEGRAGRRGMDALREKALQNLISQVEDRNFGGLRRPPGFGKVLTPSRIILIAIALSAGGIAAFLATTIEQPAPPVEVVTEVLAAPTTKVLVASQVMGIGQRISATTVEWTDWPESAVRPEFLTSSAMPDAIADIDGQVVRTEIQPGEPILEAKLVQPGGSYLASVLAPGTRGVSVPVEAATASGGFISPNDRVDVIATRIFETRQVTETILSNVRVLALNGRLGDAEVAQAEGEEAETGVFTGKALATLELSTPQAELVVNAMAIGTLALVLRPITDGAAGAPAQPTANQSIRATSPFWTK